MTRQAAQRARLIARQQPPSPTPSSASEGEDEADNHSDSTDHLKSIRIPIGDSLLSEHSPLLQELCKDGSGPLGGDRIPFHTLINLLFELSSFPSELFDAEEIESGDHSPGDICKAAIVRTQERGVEPCALSPLMTSVGRKMNNRRLNQLSSIFEEFNELSGWGVTTITRSTPEGVSKKLKTFVAWSEQSSSKEDKAFSRILSNAKLKRIEPLTNGLSCLISEYVGIALLNEESLGRVSKLVEWLEAMTSSCIRPLRLTAIVCLSILVDCLISRLADARITWTQTTGQYQSEPNSTVRAVQMDALHEMGRSIVRAISLLLGDIVPEAQTRATDVSWLVISQTCQLLGSIGAAFPRKTLMTQDDRLVLILTFLTRHENPQVRAIALETAGKLLRALVECGTPDQLLTISADFTLPIPTSMPELAVYEAQIQKLCHVKPDAAVLKGKLDRLWTCVLRHLRDCDVRVGVCAAEMLSSFALLEAEYKEVCGLQDDQISRACSLLFLVDNPCVSTRIATFIDGALFAKSIIDEGEARRLMAGGSAAARTPEQSTALSTQLSTVVEWLVEYADDDTWKKYHLTGLKAFATLAPVLQHWDNLWQHVCVAFSKNTLASVQEDASLFKSVKNVSGTWVSEKSAEALLAITLSMLEIRRFAITGITRYAQITDFRDLISQERSCSWIAEELTSEGLDVTSCGLELWKPRANVNPRILSTCKEDLVKSLRYIPMILRCGKTSQRLQWLALSLTFEIVAGVKGLEVDLEGQAAPDLTVIQSLKNIASITTGILTDAQDNWLTLQGGFSLLRKLSSVTETEEAPISQSCEELAKSLSDFLDNYRKTTIEGLTSKARSFLTKLETGAVTQKDEEGLSSSLILTNILASNDTTNTFCAALATLDDLISIVELKIGGKQPSDRIVSQILDVVWSALTRWCTQVEIRFLSHIHPAVTQLTERRGDPRSELLTRFEDKLVSFKEDMDIYKELTTQFTTFSARICEDLRLRLRQMGDDPAKDCARKSAIIAAVRIVKYVILSTYYHTVTSLWYLIQRDMMNLRRLELSHVVTLNVLEASKEIEGLCVACRETPPTESTQEVSYFVDFLKSISSGAEKTAAFDISWLENGLLAHFHTPRNLLPQTASPVTICDAYGTITKEEHVNSFLNQLPRSNTLASMYHVQLLASLCQVPDVSLWKDATVGPVILSYLRGKSVILQELAKVFLGRVVLYDKIRRAKLEEIKNSADVDERAFLVVNDAPLLVTLILRLLPPMMDRAREKGTNKDVILLAQRIGSSLPSSYFLELPTNEYINVLWMTIRTSWQEKLEDGENSGLLLDLFSNHLFQSKSVRRRWAVNEARDQANALKECIRHEFDKCRGRDDEKLLSECCQARYHAAFERFLSLAFGGALQKKTFRDWLPQDATSTSSASQSEEEEEETMAD